MTAHRAAPVEQTGGAPQLNWGQRIGYGVGDFAFNLYFTTAGLFLLYYYTDVLGISPATAGWVFASALIWDALFDPVMGFIASRTRSRWGRYRPYILWGAIPLALSWTLIFFPTALVGGPLVLFAIGAHILFRTLYAVVNMPFLSLSAVLTRSSQERSVLAGIRMVAAASCGLLSAALTLKLAAVFGGGQTGFFRVAILYGALASVVLFIVFLKTKEVETPTEEAQPTARDMLYMLRRNRAFWIAAAAMLLASIANTFFQKSLPYFFKYSLHREDLIGPALALLAGCVALSIPLWTWVAKRWSKRVMWISGIVIGLVGSIAMWFAPPTPNAYLIAFIPVGIGAGASYLGFWSMMPDTVEFGEWRSGVRAEGAVFGLVTLIQKAGLGLAAAALGETLTMIGYHPNAAQTAETLGSIRTIMIAVPAAISLTAIALIAFYPIDQKLHDRLLRAIARRHGAGQRES